MAFSPPKILDASVLEHLPYFYEGFNLFETGFKQGGLLNFINTLSVQDKFGVACDCAFGDRVSLLLNANQPLLLKHGNLFQKVNSGISEVIFTAAPDERGILCFERSEANSLSPNNQLSVMKVTAL